MIDISKSVPKYYYYEVNSTNIVQKQQELASDNQVSYKLSDFIIEKELGKGNFSTVYLVKYKINNNLYSMKEIKSGRYKSELEILKVQKKIKLLQTLENRHVIIYFSSFKTISNFL